MARPRLKDTLLTIVLLPRQLAKRLGSMMPAVTRAQGLTVLAMDGQWLKVLHVEGQAKRITKCLACPIAGASPDDIHKAFTEACATEGLSPRDVLVANPTHLCTIRLFTLPSTDPNEIRDIVELQAEKHTPYAKEELLKDFALVDRNSAGYSRVLLVIAHQDVIHRPVQLVSRGALNLERVGCELEGLINWFHLARRVQPAAKGGGASLVVDVDGGATTLLVMHQGQPVFHRSLATGAEQLENDPAPTREQLVGELQRSLEALEVEGGPGKVQDVILTGRIERLDELKTAVEQALDVPVSLLAPWAVAELPEATRAAVERLPDVSFAGLVGLALAPNHIDLTPAATKLHQAFEARARALMLLGCQGVAAFILIALAVIGRAQKEQRYADTLRAMYEKTATGAFYVEEALRHTEFVDQRLRQRGLLLDAVQKLAEATRSGITWESLTYTLKDGIVLKATSEVLPNVYEFVAELDQSLLFNHVEARRVTKRASGEKDLTDFEVVCHLSAAAP